MTEQNDRAATTANNADIIARRLAEQGCRFAFGIPGGEVLTLCEALRAAGIKVLLCKHENAGGFMAEGTHHMTGAPAVLVATIGPGVANAVNVVANAWQDRVPMIFLTGCVDPAEAATYTHQVFDHTRLLGAVTKASLTVADGAADVIIDKALSIATSGRPGPVHVDLPIGVADAKAVANGPVAGKRARPRTAPAGPDLEAARELVAGAERPILLVGVDALNDGAEAEVAAFNDRFGWPVVTTYKAKGIVDEARDNVLGGAGLSPKADALLLPLFAEADLVLAVGYDPIEMRAGWRRPWPESVPMIDLVAEANTHYMHQPTMSFVCHTGAGLKALTDGVTPRPVWADGAPAKVRQALAEAFAPPTEWGAHAVFRTAREVLPADAVVTADSGAHRILLSQMWTCHAPRGLLQSTGLCTMGCAVPLAIGARLAAPGRPVAAFVGDAGLEMVLGELATARELDAPVIVIVLVDDQLGLIELKQRRAQLPNVAVDFNATDFEAVANAMGGVGATVNDAGALADEIRTAMQRDSFTVIACRIGRRAYDGAF